jgi:hypothetical protein
VWIAAKFSSASVAPPTALAKLHFPSGRIQLRKEVADRTKSDSADSYAALAVRAFALSLQVYSLTILTEADLATRADNLFRKEQRVRRRSGISLRTLARTLRKRSTFMPNQ